MGEFYRSISRHYDDIFPLSDMLKKFLLSFGVKKEDTILDLGCATGEVALFLAQHCKETVGIDLDPDLIRIATAKQKKRGTKNTQFLVGDMADLSIFSSVPFNFVLCLGNTIVHLNSLEDVDTFFDQVANTLTDGGKFIFQILNYENILARRTLELPLIDNEKITFERRYDHETHKPHLAFNTRLTVKATSEVIGNSIDLYPLSREELLNIPSMKLFRSIQFFGGFDGRAFSKEDDLLIGVWGR